MGESRGVKVGAIVRFHPHFHFHHRVSESQGVRVEAIVRGGSPLDPLLIHSRESRGVRVEAIVTDEEDLLEYYDGVKVEG